QNTLITGADPQRHGNAHPNIVPYETFEAKDGWLAIAAANDGLYARLCDVLEAPELASDERFATNPKRVENRQLLVPLIAQRLAQKGAQGGREALEGGGVRGGKIGSVPEALQAAADAGREATVRVPHPTAGEVELVRSPIRLTRDELRPPKAPPLL